MTWKPIPVRALSLALAGALALATSSCAYTPPADAPDPIEVYSTIARAAAQVRRCYRRPAVPYAARQIATRLRVRYAPDGTLLGLPEILAQQNVEPPLQPYAARMAEAAATAVIRCSPISLPPELYRGGWDEFELTFMPSSAA